MSTTFLDKRIGRLGRSETRDELAVQMQPSNEYKGVQEKVICLPFYDGEKVQRISILDEKREVILNGNRHISIKEIFDIFSKKNNNPGDVEYFGVNGIMNWASYELGWWSDQTKSCVKMDLNRRYQWWQQLPKLEVISRNTAEARYQVKIETGQWVKVLSSTQSELRYHLKGCHGYLEILIPLEHDQYAVYPFGKFTKTFPTSTIGELKLLAKTVPARISYPDENIAFSHRLHAYHAECISPHQGGQLMEKIKYAIENGRKENLIFQFNGKNCAYWAEETYVSKYKDMFKVPAAEMRPSDWRTQALLVPPGSCFLRLLSRCAKKGAMQITDQHGNKVIEATLFGKRYEDTPQYQPVRFSQNIRSKIFPGVTCYGNSDVLRPRFKP